MRTFPTAESPTGLIIRTVRIWVQSLQSSRFPRVLEFTVQSSELPSSPRPSSSIRIDLRRLERKAAMNFCIFFTSMHQEYRALHCIASHSCSFPLARPTWRGLPPHALGFIPLRAVPSCSAITIHFSIEHLLISLTPCMSFACPIFHFPSPLQSPIPDSQQPTASIQHPTPSIIPVLKSCI